MIAIFVVRPGVVGLRVGRAVELLPVGVVGAHLRALGPRVGVGARRRRGEEGQRVLGADDEVGQLLGWGAGAAVRLPGLGAANGLQNGSALLSVPGAGSCGRVSPLPCPCTS